MIGGWLVPSGVGGERQLQCLDSRIFFRREGESDGDPTVGANEREGAAELILSREFADRRDGAGLSEDCFGESPPGGEGAIEEKIFGDERGGQRRIPGSEKVGDLSLARLQNGGRRQVAPSDFSNFQNEISSENGGGAGARVGEIGERDDPETIVGEKLVVAAKTGQTAAVANADDPLLVALPTEAVAIRADGRRDLAPAVFGGGIESGEFRWPVHLAEGSAVDDAIVGIVTGRPGLEVEVHVPRKIVDGGEQPAHGSVDPIVQERLREPGAVFPAVAEGELVGGDLRVFPTGRAQAERFEDFAREVALIRLPGNVSDDLAEEGEGEVAVFVGDAGWVGERETAREEVGKIAWADGELAVAPRVILWKPGRHREQVAHRDSGCIGRERGDVAKLGQELRDGIGEGEVAGITQLDDGECGEALRHGGDAKTRLAGGGDFLGDVGPADGARVDEIAVEDEAPHEAGVIFLDGGLVKDPVNFGPDGLQLGAAGVFAKARGRVPLSGRGGVSGGDVGDGDSEDGAGKGEFHRGAALSLRRVRAGAMQMVRAGYGWFDHDEF